MTPKNRPRSRYDVVPTTWVTSTATGIHLTRVCGWTIFAYTLRCSRAHRVCSQIDKVGRSTEAVPCRERDRGTGTGRGPPHDRRHSTQPWLARHRLGNSLGQHCPATAAARLGCPIERNCKLIATNDSIWEQGSKVSNCLSLAPASESPESSSVATATDTSFCHGVSTVSAQTTTLTLPVPAGNSIYGAGNVPDINLTCQVKSQQEATPSPSSIVSSV